MVREDLQGFSLVHGFEYLSRQRERNSELIYPTSEVSGSNLLGQKHQLFCLPSDLHAT